MIVEADMNEFLSHHGVKGMKWGQRRTRQKLGIVGAGVGSYVVGAAIGARVFAQFGKNMNPAMVLPVVAVAEIGATVVGVKATKRFLDRKGDKPVRGLSKSEVDRRVEEILKNQSTV